MRSSHRAIREPRLKGTCHNVVLVSRFTVLHKRAHHTRTSFFVYTLLETLIDRCAEYSTLRARLTASPEEGGTALSELEDKPGSLNVSGRRVRAALCV